jgi:hypothetical protein
MSSPLPGSGVVGGSGVLRRFRFGGTGVVLVIMLVIRGAGATGRRRLLELVSTVLTLVLTLLVGRRREAGLILPLELLEGLVRLPSLPLINKHQILVLYILYYHRNLKTQIFLLIKHII